MGMNIHFTILERAKNVIYITFFILHFKLTFRSAVSAALDYPVSKSFLFY